jgi:glyceraldehyde 3-phosphate dehydrogenase
MRSLLPTRTGSIAELNLLTERKVTVDEVNDAFRKAAAVPPLNGVMSVLEDEWASSRILGDLHSSIVDLPLTAVQGDLLSVAAWYDNEMGYSARLAEMAAQIATSKFIVTQEPHKGVLAVS